VTDRYVVVLRADAGGEIGAVYGPWVLGTATRLRKSLACPGYVVELHRTIPMRELAVLGAGAGGPPAGPVARPTAA
jgi:hypothetical protein